MSTIDPNQLAAEITRTLKEFTEVTEASAMAGVIETADYIVNELHSAHPPGSEKYGSWDKYNGSWERTTLKQSKNGGYWDVIHNKKHYQLAHLLEKGHALRGGGRTRAFPHIAEAAEHGESKLLENIKKHLN